jgi:hypothetical protein
MKSLAKKVQQISALPEGQSAISSSTANLCTATTPNQQAFI